MSSPQEKELPPGADGDESIRISNETFDLRVGETETGTWVWEFDGHSTLYHEFFAMQETGTGSSGVVESYDSGEMVSPFPSKGQPGNPYSATMDYDVAGTRLRVKRTVQLDTGFDGPGRPILTVRYDITNVGDGDVDLDFFQHADFDDGSNDYRDDIGEYEPDGQYFFVRDEAGTAYSGMGTNKSPKNHHVGPYEYDHAVGRDALNNQDKYPESGSGDPVTAFEWDFGTVEPGATRDVTVQFGAATTREDIENRIEEPKPVYSIPPEPGVRASAATVAFVPGLSENDDAGGNDLYSAFPNQGSDALGLTDEAGYVPVDDGFLGDKTKHAPAALTTFEGMRKSVQGLDRRFGQYRMRHKVDLRAVPEDGDLTGAVVVRLYNDGENIEAFYHTDLDDQIEFDYSGQQPSFTVLEEDMVDEDDPNNEIAKRTDSQSDRYERAHQHRQYVYVDKAQVDGVDAIQLSSMFGASNPYTRQIVSETFGEAPIADAFAPDNPIIYSWIELTVLADGRRLVRIPDMSRFPKHVGYLNGIKRSDSGLDVIFETNTDSGGGYDVAVDEDDNNAWEEFRSNAEKIGPWEGPVLMYLLNWRERNDFEKPVMAFGRGSSGKQLDRSETLNVLPSRPEGFVPNGR